MKAMILAAGLGTRLRPLTTNRPKALVEISGRTLLDITLSRLRSFGVTKVVINVHHFADMVIDYLQTNRSFGMQVEISREDVLLDTGGGLKKAAWFFLDDCRNVDEPFLLHNVDVLSTIDLARMLQFHTEHHALATLAVQSRESSRLLLFNDHLQLCGRASSTADSAPSREFGAMNPGPSGTAPSAPSREFSAMNLGCAPEPSIAPSPRLQPFAFSGIHIISPRLLPLLTEEGIFSIIDSYLRLSAQGQKILAFRAEQYYWRDLGRPSDLSQAAQDLQQNPAIGANVMK